MSIENGKQIENELTKIYNLFNNHFWNNELPEVMITFTPTKGAYGHLSSIPIWISENNSAKYELNISAYTMNRPVKNICETILHEQVHLYCILKNIKDTSNMNRYHNKRFKEVCEAHGLICKKLAPYGWTRTSFSDDGLRYFKRLNLKEFSYHYADISNRGSTLNRYACPKCNDVVVWMTSHNDIICGNCNERLIYMPRRKK